MIEQRDVDRLNLQLLERGWIPEFGAFEPAWHWPHPNNPTGVNLLHPNPLIWLEEGEEILVEGPLRYEGPTPLLCYRTTDELLVHIDQIEQWAYPKRPDDIDAEHTRQTSPATRDVQAAADTCSQSAVPITATHSRQCPRQPHHPRLGHPRCRL